MPLDRPSLQELIERVYADIESQLPGTDARLRRSNLGVLGRTHSGVTHGLYGHLDWQSKQLLPDTAELEYLERHASVYKITRIAAGKAAGSITFTGTDTSVIPAGTIVQRSDAVEFTTDAEATINAGSAIAAVTAVEGGVASNTDAGSSVTLVNPIAGVNSTASVTTAIANGTDAESDDSLRERLLDRIQQPPHGGAEFDYVKWAKEVSGVTRAWEYPQEMGIGTVTVRFVVDDHAVSSIPDAAKVTEVQDHIDSVRPVTVKGLYVVAPLDTPLDITITGLNPDTQEVRDAITAELKDLLRREAVPGGTILISHIREAISIAAGEHDHALTVPAADVTHSTGEIATLGVITWS